MAGDPFPTLSTQIRVISSTHVNSFTIQVQDLLQSCLYLTQQSLLILKTTICFCLATKEFGTKFRTQTPFFSFLIPIKSISCMKHYRCKQNYFLHYNMFIKLNTSPICPLPPRFQCKAEHVDGSVKERGIKNTILVIIIINKAAQTL